MGPKVEPLYKGQIGDGSYGGASLQGTDRGGSYGGASLQGTSKAGLTVKPLYKGQVERVLQWSLSTRDKRIWVLCCLYLCVCLYAVCFSGTSVCLCVTCCRA